MGPARVASKLLKRADAHYFGLQKISAGVEAAILDDVAMPITRRRGAAEAAASAHTASLPGLLRKAPLGRSARKIFDFYSQFRRRELA